MRGFVDIHHHIVFDWDDGPATFAQSCKMLDAAQQDGIRHLIATSHAEPGRVAFETDLYYDKIDALNQWCRQNGRAITVYPGAEILYTDAALRFLQGGAIPTLAGRHYVLVEFMPDVTYDRLFNAVRTLANGGYIPVLAHMERYMCLVKDYKRIAEMKALLDIRVQINCSTIIQAKRFATRRFVRTVLQEGLLDFVATDAHNLTTRPVCMRKCYEVLRQQVGDTYATLLCGKRQMHEFFY